MGEKMHFSELDQYLFGQGTHYDIYKKLGAHPTTQGRKKGVYFAVWVPNAQSVSVVGDFNSWDTEANPMVKAGPIGVFEVFVPGAKTRQILMAMKQSFVREPRQRLQISGTINGKILHG